MTVLAVTVEHSILGVSGEHSGGLDLGWTFPVAEKPEARPPADHSPQRTTSYGFRVLAFSLPSAAFLTKRPLQLDLQHEQDSAASQHVKRSPHYRDPDCQHSPKVHPSAGDLPLQHRAIRTDTDGIDSFLLFYAVQDQDINFYCDELTQITCTSITPRGQNNPQGRLHRSVRCLFAR